MPDLTALGPVQYALLVLAVAASLGLLGAGLWALRQRLRPRARGVAGSTALARAASYAGLALALGLAAAFGLAGITVLVTVLGALALAEWSALTDLPRHHRVAIQVANVSIMVVIAILGPAGAEWLIGGLILLGIVWPVARPDPERAMRDFGFAALGCIIVSGMLVHGVGLVVDRGEIGAVLFIALAAGAAGADVGAFIVGRRFGRTPLAPRLSPNKTRAGLVGSIVGATLGILPFAPVLVPALGPLFVAALALLVAVGSVWGDLLESAAKREAGVKDAASWLPGFGGILDRIDSLLVVLPMTYWAMRVLDVAQGR